MNKKQILSVAAGVVMLTACSEYDPELTKGEVGDYTPADLQLMEKYTENFEARYGKIDENHTWGFGSTEAGAKTRGADPNGNEWATQKGYDVPEKLEDEVKDIVRQYFQQHPNLTYIDPQWTDFWVEQVYKGGTNTEGSQTTETYTLTNNSSVIGGTTMDELKSKNADGKEEHIYDFNNGDNKDWEGLMLMVGSSTYSFGYHQSNAGIYHYDKAALVNWKVIYEWAKEKNLKGYEKLNDGWNRSYMGFDWAQTDISSLYSANYDWNNGGVFLGYNTFEFGGNTYNYLKADASNQGAYDESEPTFHGRKNIDNDNEKTDALISELLRLGYLPYSDTLKDWVKPATGADGYYSDWIVSLAEAKNSNTPDDSSEKTWYRIMCEDLGNTNDFDFNDLVFDVYFTENKSNGDYPYTAHVEVKAAGGTLPIYLMYNENNAYEAHHLLGCESTSTPINVGIGNDGYKAKEIEIPMKTQDADAITIYVEKTKQDAELATTTIELPRVGSIASKAPQKICIPNGQNVRWMKEMQQIESAYPHFADWVQNESYGFKWTTTEVNTAPLY